jgi:hypothetical protein
MRLEFIGKTKGRITDVAGFTIKLGQKDNRPAAQLHVRATAPNAILDKFSPRIRTLLFEKAAGSEKMQKQLEGIEVVSDLPNLTEEGSKLGTLSWNDEQTGCTFIVDRAIDPLKLRDCKASDFKIRSRDGGTVQVDFTLVTGEIDRDTAGDLLLLKDTDIMFELEAAQVHQQELPSEEDGDEPDDAGDGLGEELTPEKALAGALQQHAEGKEVTVKPPARKTPVAKKIARAAGKQSRRAKA